MVLLKKWRFHLTDDGGFILTEWTDMDEKFIS